ncbi:MAG: 50S ribosomal protein L29 [Calditrichaeota bacterium]|nr:50S ribosomal protein L29 [Calditrichota bacterium]
MKIQEIRELSFQELKDKVAEKAEELANLKFQHALHQLDNTANVRIIRREYSRMLTIAKEHESGIRKLSEQESGASE